MKKILGLILVVPILLSSCGKAIVAPVVSGEKQVMNIDTIIVGKTSFSTDTKRTGRISASSALTLTAQGAGEISKLSVKEGQNVRAGTTIATLKDTINNYDLRLSQAENTLAVQEASINTTKINLEQGIENARIAYERAKQSYETLNGKNTLQDATLMNANSKTLDTYNTTYKSYLSDIERNLTQMLYSGDKILGISTNFEYANDSWEPYLGVRVWDSKALAAIEWNKAYGVRGLIRARTEKSDTLSSLDPLSDVELVGSGYAQTRKYVDAMLYMIQNNLVGAGLSQELQAGWLAEWNGLRSQIQASESGYNTWKSQVLTFLKTYKNNETATRLAVASLNRALTPEELTLLDTNPDTKLAYENTKLSLKDQLANTKLSLEQAQKAYETAQSLKDATITQLETGRKSAQIAYEQAKRDYSKLIITAPVDGVITKVLSSIGQNVSIGSPIAEFSWKQPQILTDIDPSIAASLSVWDILPVTVDDTITLSWVVSAVSTISNANLLSTVRIALPKSEKYIGKTATILFPEGNSEKQSWLALKLDSVNIITEGEGEIYILGTDNKPMKKQVKLGKIRGNIIEILDTFVDGTIIISSDMSNYDPAKFDLKINK
jgi:multidrug efflux pump subunit AcrA (membrane-fusion protein)